MCFVLRSSVDVLPSKPAASSSRDRSGLINSPVSNAIFFTCFVDAIECFARIDIKDSASFDVRPVHAFVCHRVACILQIGTPFEIVNMVIQFIAILVVYDVLAFDFWDKRRRHQPMHTHITLFAVSFVETYNQILRMLRARQTRFQNPFVDMPCAVFRVRKVPVQALHAPHITHGIFPFVALNVLPNLAGKIGYMYHFLRRLRCLDLCPSSLPSLGYFAPHFCLVRGISPKRFHGFCLSPSSFVHPFSPPTLFSTSHASKSASLTMTIFPTLDAFSPFS